MSLLVLVGGIKQTEPKKKKREGEKFDTCACEECTQGISVK